MFSLLNECKDYTPNNINYRVVTSQYLALYKMQQSRSLSEIINNAPNHRFSDTAKEIVLTKYNFWFTFMLWLESYLLKYNEYTKDMTEEEMEQIKEIIKNKAEDVVQQHDNLMKDLIEKTSWNREFYNLWVLLHNSQIFPFITRVIKETPLKSVPNYFTVIARNLTATLSLTIYETYELDHLFSDKEDNTIILYVDETHFKISKELMVCCKKVQILKEKFNISNDKIIIKSFVPNSILMNTNCYKELEKQFKKIIIE